MAVQTDKVKQIFLTLEKWRIDHNLTQKEVATRIGISPSSYTKFLNGDIADMKLSVLDKISQLTGLMPFQLAEDYSTKQKEVMNLITHMPDSALRFVQTIAEFEYGFSRSHKDYEDYITVLEPTGVLDDGMYYDSANISKVNAAHYRDIYGSRLICGIRITSNIFHPVYNQGDILLISSEPPHHRQTGIFYNKKTKKLYIRQYFESNPEFRCCILEPIVKNRDWERIYVDSDNKEDMDQWEKFGIVLGKMR